MKQGIDVTGDLLKAVSRSFYLTIRFLPQQMRPAVALAYMLARATDSVADTSAAGEDERIAALQRMAAAIAGEEEADLEQLLSDTLAPQQQKPEEATLLSRFMECVAALKSFPEEQVALIRKVLATIIEGQLWDLRFFRDHDCVQNDGETRRYTYSVAGCVGEFWTELGYATMGERFCELDRKEVMLEAGSRFGQGLQLINILRDRAEDAARGRSYICSSPGRWMLRAQRYMMDGVDYSRRLGSFRLRFASMLPALIGAETLKLLHAQADSGVRVKIPRRKVYFCMVKAFFASLFKQS